MNASVGLGEPLLGMSPSLEVAPLSVVESLELAPLLEVAPLMRSRGLTVVQVWACLRMGYKRGGSGGGVEADWGIS